MASHSVDSRCTSNSDCNTLAEICSQGICERKPLFPLLANEYFAVVLMALGVTLTNASGLGGGAIVTSILLSLMGMQQTEAIPLSNFLMMTGSIARLIAAWTEKHPDHPHRPAIHYDFAILLLPMSLAGSILGVVINITFPVVIQNICLFLIFGFVLWKSLVKGIQSYRLES